MSRPKQLVYIGIVLVGAVFVLVYRGIYWPFVRGHMGDWLVVQFIYLIGRFWISFKRRYYLAVGVLLFAFLVEVFQGITAGSIPHTLAIDLTLGSTFDFIDLIAYILGVATVLIIDTAMARTAKPADPGNFQPK